MRASSPGLSARSTPEGSDAPTRPRAAFQRLFDEIDAFPAEALRPISGDIQATVVISGGRIASAVISECWTRYPCSWIVRLPPQVAERQSPEVDYVSGATQSTNAFYYAVVQALAKAK